MLHSHSTNSVNTIAQLVLRAPRARVVESHGDGFGSYIERLINAAHETHRAFPNLLGTLQGLVDHLREELDRTYSQYQFAFIVGKHFDFDRHFSNPSVLIEHTGMKVLIFSSIGPLFKRTTTSTSDHADDQKALLW